MAFDLYVRGKRQWPAGFEAPQPGRLNAPFRHVRIGARSSTVVAKPVNTLPEITVHMHVEPVYVKRAQSVTLRENGGDLAPYPLYTGGSTELEQWGHVECLRFTAQRVEGVGHERLEIPDGGLTFERLFKIQNTPVNVDCHIAGSAMTITPPGCLNGRPLFMYGGYVKPGCRLEEIEPITFVPFGRMGATGVTFTRASTWLGRGVPMNGSIGGDGSQFQGALCPEDVMPLNTWLREGHGRLHWPLGISPDGQACVAVYASCQVAQTQLLSPHLTLTFQYKEIVCL
jgi:hypothetical protein